MKGLNKIALILIMILSLSMLSCQSNKASDSDTNKQNNNFTADTASNTAPAETNRTLDSYDFFDNAMQANPIDKAYSDALDKGEKNFSEIMMEYTSAWKAEFNRTLELYRELCGDDNKAHTESIEAWSAAEEALWKWEQEEIFGNSISTYGTQFYYEQLKQVGDNYRNKTIWMKRMCFVKETNMNSDLYNDKLRSISFNVD